MAVKIKSIKNMVNQSGIKILVHGPAGAGKTVLCCTAGEPTLIISAESGLLSVRDAPDYIKCAEVDSLDDLEDLYDFLVEDGGETFKWVALDSITEIAERILHKEKADNKDPRAAYGKLTDHVMDLLRRFRDLRGYNVVMSCKQSRIQGDGPTFFGPMMPGQQLPQQIPYLFDEVFALRVEKDEDGENYRVLQTSRDAQYEAKDRSGALDMFEEPNLKKIAQKILGKVQKRENKKEVKIEVEEVETEEVEDEVATSKDSVKDEAEVETKTARRTLYWHNPNTCEIGIIKRGTEYELTSEIELITKAEYLALEEEYDENQRDIEEE